MTVEASQNSAPQLPGGLPAGRHEGRASPEFIPHSLRHPYASTALAEGIPITEVSRWLGHKSIEVTHQVYGHLIPSSFDRARAVLDNAYQKSRRQPPGKAGR